MNLVNLWNQHLEKSRGYASLIEAVPVLKNEYHQGERQMGIQKKFHQKIYDPKPKKPIKKIFLIIFLIKHLMEIRKL